MRALERLDKFLAKLELIVVATFATFALSIGVMQVVARYVFNTGIPGTEAVFITLTIWAMLVGGSRAVRDNMHARVTIFENVLPAFGVRICNLLSLITSFALCSFFFYCGILYTRFVYQMGVADIETNIPDWITYSIVPIAMSAFSLRYLILITQAFRDPARLDPPELGKNEERGV